MVRFVPHVLLAASCLFLWGLWEEEIYPFTLLFFTYNGYWMHFVGGIGFTAAQVLFSQVARPSLYFSTKFFTAHAMIAISALGAGELLQGWDASHTVQLEDFLIQSLGVLVALSLLGFLERKHVRR